MKKEVRVLGIDDAPFTRDDVEVLVVATVFRGGEFMDGVLSTRINRDGEDATLKLIDLVNNSKFGKHAQAIFLDGIALGGFNVVNINVLARKTGIPVIVVSRKKPRIQSFAEALERIGMSRKAGIVREFPKPEKHRKVYVQTAGISLEKARNLLDLCTTRSFLPEPIRIAHLIGAGVRDGESSGRA